MMPNRALRTRKLATYGVVFVLGALAAILFGLDGGGPPTADDLAQNAKAEVPPPASELMDAPRREALQVTTLGEHKVRALDGPGIQGWLGVDGAPLPAFLLARGPGVPAGTQVEVAADGRFAVPNAAVGARYLLQLPEGLVTSWAPTDDSVVGSRYVHVIAPARMDVLVQALADVMQFTLLLPGGEPAAFRRAQVAVDGARLRVMTVETDIEGTALAPLPPDGWWTNASITPQAEEGVLYERFWIARVDLSGSGNAGTCRMKRAASSIHAFFDVEDRPVSGVRAAPPSTSTTSGADGQLVLLNQDMGRVQWLHPELDAAHHFNPVDGSKFPCTRMVPRGNVTWLFPDPEKPNDFELDLVPGAYDDRLDVDPRPQYGRRRQSLRQTEIGWRIENVAMEPSDGLLLTWRGVAYWKGPVEYGHGERLRSLPMPRISEYSLLVYHADGSPASGVLVQSSGGYLARTDGSGSGTFELPDASEIEFLNVKDYHNGIELSYPFNALGRPTMPAVIRLPELTELSVRVDILRPRSLGDQAVIETDWDGATLRGEFRADTKPRSAGRFPIGTRLYRIRVPQHEVIEVWHNAASEAPLVIHWPD